MAHSVERTWVIDGANMVGSRPDGWWRDRPGAAARLYRRLLRLLAGPAAENGPAVAAGDHPGGGQESRLTAPQRPAGDGQGCEGHRGGDGAVAGRWETRPGQAERRPGLPARVVLVLEGAARAGVVAGTTEAGGSELTVVHAPGSGDDAIVAAAREAPAPVLVWTSDRGLRARLAGAGDIRTAGCGGLWNLLDAAAAC